MKTTAQPHGVTYQKTPLVSYLDGSTVRSCYVLNRVSLSARLNADDVRLLDEMGHDPEVTPGLFQGDLALTDEVRCSGTKVLISVL
jgi:hypothetical protein